MAIENDGIVGGPAFVVSEGGDSGFATEVTPLVTISAAEYRELCGKAALWDEYRAMRESMDGDGGDDDDADRS